HRPRPDLVDHLDRTFTSSFPSAHAMVSMIAWLAFGMVAIRFISIRRLRIYVFWAAVIVALIIGGTRVYLGVHWPSDVVAGWAIGLAWASMCWLVADRFCRTHIVLREQNSDTGCSS
ncbi:MAG: phosphatase PAP2 family protein, partial [Hyphomicrobiales bacterium]